MRFFYGTAPGRILFKALLGAGLPKWIALYLRSPFSRGMIPGFIKKHGIDMSGYEEGPYKSFAQFFIRQKKNGVQFDSEPSRLISPCDGWLSAYPIRQNASFEIKGSNYRVADLVGGADIADEYQDGLCLVFRLTPSDYHRYVFIDDGRVGVNHFIEGKLHCVQPIALAAVPVFRLNRRCWTVLETENFGPVVQIEVGAVAVGGIVNDVEKSAVQRGREMGRFELCGSTIVQLFKKDAVALLPRITAELTPDTEVQVKVGEWIGLAQSPKTPR